MGYELLVKEASVNALGDIVCPHCGVNIITPYGCYVKPGEGTCPVCKEMFEVTEGIANDANVKGPT